MTRAGSRIAAALAGLALGACLPSVSGTAPPECLVTTDCPISGQLCDDGVCWGGLPEAARGPRRSARPASARAI